MSTATLLPINPRWMIRQDLEEVLRIEQASFEVPWTMEEALDYLRKPDQIGKTAEAGEQVVGFMFYRLGKGHLFLDTIAVTPAFRRRGVGVQLIDHLASRLSSGRRTKILSRVSERNLSALLFLKTCGFRAIGLERGPYEETDDDAIRMEYRA